MAPSTLLATCPATLSPGLALGNWRLGPALPGQDAAGFGHWYEAEHALASGQTRTALVMAPGPQAAALILRYGELTAELDGLSHPLIQLPSDSGFTACGRPYLLLNGHRRGQALLQGAAALSLPQRLQAVLQLCEALREVHQHGFLFSEIDPAMLWLDPQGQLQLMGLSLTRMPDPEALHSVASPAANPVCMSPELRAGGRPSLSSEVYSLGVLLHLLVKGCLPQGQNLGLLAPPSDAAWRQLPAQRQQSLSALLAKATAEQASARYLAIESLADDLQAWLAQAAAPESQSHEHKQPRPRWLSLSKLSLGALVAFGACMQTGNAVQPTHNTEASPALTALTPASTQLRFMVDTGEAAHRP